MPSISTDFLRLAVAPPAILPRPRVWVWRRCVCDPKGGRFWCAGTEGLPPTAMIGILDFLRGWVDATSAISTRMGGPKDCRALVEYRDLVAIVVCNSVDTTPHWLESSLNQTNQPAFARQIILLWCHCILNSILDYGIETCSSDGQYSWNQVEEVGGCSSLGGQWYWTWPHCTHHSLCAASSTEILPPLCTSHSSPDRASAVPAGRKKREGGWLGQWRWESGMI